MTLAEVINHPRRDRLAIRPVNGSGAFFELSDIRAVESAEDKYFVGVGRRYPHGISNHGNAVFTAASGDEMEVIVIGGDPDGTWFSDALRGKLLGHRVRHGGQGVSHVQKVNLAGPLAYDTKNLCGSSMGVIYALTVGEIDLDDEKACMATITADAGLIAEPAGALDLIGCRRCAQRYTVIAHQG